MIHNIWNILKCFRRDADHDELLQIENFEDNFKKYKSFFAELLSYYISGRYPSFKEKVSNSVDKDKAKKVLNNTEKVFKWIESLSQYKK